MADKQLGLLLTADGRQVISEFDNIGKAMGNVQKTMERVASGSLDAEKGFERIGKVGGDAFREIIDRGQAEGRTVQEIKTEIDALANAKRQMARDAKNAYLEEAQALAIIGQRQAEQARAVAEASTQLHAKAQQFVSDLMQAGSELAKMQRQIKITFGETEEAKQAVETIRTLKVETGTTEEALTSAAVSMKKFGAYSDENLTLAAVAAKKTNKSVEEVAETIGRFQKFGDARSERQFKKMFGFDDKDIEAAGGYMEALGKKFGQTTDGLVSDSTKLQAEFAHLREDIGISLVHSMNDVASAALPFVKQLRDMPDAMKGAIGQGAVVVNTLSGIGSSALSVAAQMRMAGLTFSGAFNAMMGALGPVNIALLALAAAVSAATLAIQINSEKIDKETEKWEQQNKVLRDNRDIRLAIANGKPVPTDKAEGNRKALLAQEKQLLEEISALEGDRALQASADPNSDQVKDLDTKIEEKQQTLRRLRGEVSSTSRAIDNNRVPDAYNKAAVEDQKKAADDSAKAWDNYRMRVSNGAYETKAAQLAALDEVTKKVQQHGRDWTEAELKASGASKEEQSKILKAQQTMVLERNKLVREAADEQVKTDQHALEMQVAQGTVSHAQLAASYEEMSQRQNISLQERQRLELQAVNERKAANSEALKDDLDVLQRKVTAGKMTAAQEETSLREILATHTLTNDERRQVEDKLTAAHKHAVDQRLADELRALEIKKAKGQATLADEAALLRKQALDPELDPSQRSEKDLKASQKEKEIRDKAVAEQKEMLKLRLDEMKAQEQILHEQAAKGADVTGQLIDLHHKQYEAERAEIRQTAREKQESAELLAARLRAVDAKEQQDVRKVGEDRLKYLQEELKKREEIEAKKKEAQGFHKGPQDITEAFKNNFGFSNELDKPAGGEAPPLPGGVSVDELKHLLSQPNIDPTDPRVASLYARLKQNQTAAVRGGSAGSQISVDANGNRVLTPGSDVASGAGAGTGAGGNGLPLDPGGAGAAGPAGGLGPSGIGGAGGGGAVQLSGVTFIITGPCSIQAAGDVSVEGGGGDSSSSGSSLADEQTSGKQLLNDLISTI